MPETVTHIVSLGASCATAYNIRRFWAFGDAYPFDWWITPFRALSRFLADPDLDALYDPAQLERAEKPNSVVSRRYGIALHHEFKRGQDGRPIADFAEHIEAPKARTGYLLQRFLGLNAPGNRIVFVRHGTVPADLPELLGRLFPRAKWRFAHAPGVEGGDFDWRGDPARWDAIFGALDVTLDDRQRRPFAETDVRHEIEHGSR